MVETRNMTKGKETPTKGEKTPPSAEAEGEGATTYSLPQPLLPTAETEEAEMETQWTE